MGVFDADRSGCDAGSRENACHGVEAAVLHELLDLAMETGKRITLGRDEVGPGRDGDAECMGARDEPTSEAGVAPLREAAVRVLSQHAVRPRVESEGGIQNRPATGHLLKQLGEDRGLRRECSEGWGLLVVVLGRRVLHRFPRDPAHVRDDVHTAADHFQRPRREDHAMGPDGHPLPMRLVRDPPHVGDIDVRVDLDAGSPRSARHRYSLCDVGAGLDRLDPGNVPHRLAGGR